MKATINFATSELTLFDGSEMIPLTTNAAGHFVVNVLGSPTNNQQGFKVMMNQPDDEAAEPPEDPADPVPADVLPSSDIFRGAIHRNRFE